MNYKILIIKHIISVTLLLSLLAPARADTTVFAAASLKNAIDDVRLSWLAQQGGKPVSKLRVSYAGSSVLARQIERGAPADIFISADLDWMDYLAQHKLINEASRAMLLRNELVMIAPSGSKISLKLERGIQLGGLLGDGRLSIADPTHVPAGKYAKAGLEALGLWSQVSAKLARGENVRTALNFVARGETPLGIVYRTDAAAEPKVRVVAAFPLDTHPPIVYPAALLAASRSDDAAAFFAFLKTGTAAGIFRKHGFLTY